MAYRISPWHCNCEAPNFWTDQWMDNILHQLVDGSSQHNPIIYSVSCQYSYQLVQDFVHLRYVLNNDGRVLETMAKGRWRLEISWNGYGSIPIDTFLVGWTSIYQLFWGSLGTRVLTHPQISFFNRNKPQNSGRNQTPPDAAPDHLAIGELVLELVILA